MKSIPLSFFVKAAVATAVAAIPVNAAILLNTAGVPVTETFAIAPAAAEWATLFTAQGTTYSDEPTLTAGVNNTFAVGNKPVSGPVATGTDDLFRHANDLASQFLYSSPAVKGAIIVEATVRNNTGVTQNSLILSYNLTVLTIPGSGNELPGYHFYYSSTGDLNSWTRDAALSQSATGTYSSTFELTDWTSGSDIYLRWVDDNAANPDTLEEGRFGLDNVSFTAIPEPTSAMLLGIAGLGLLLRRRSR